ncbi:hypothetical protein [Actinocrispum sp. NPDC049592]|uniref:hypothetical protein n=1 Tax=Actinocrispum sp. NPDC049592 TaxID=3154835 RepID=UPI00342B7852
MDARENGRRNVGLLTAALAAVGVAGTFGVVAIVHNADATTTTTSTSSDSSNSSTSDSGVWSGGNVSSGGGHAQAQSGAS